jgi:phage terminase small subunit
VAKRKDKAGKPKRITVKLVQSTENLPPPVIPTVLIKPEVDEDSWGEDGLTIRQRAFVQAITGPAAGNATKAAEMAGYMAENYNSLKVTASRLLTYANVQEAISHVFAQRKMTPEWAVSAITDIASASMANFLSVGDDGRPVFDWAKAAAAGAIGHVREYKEDGIEGSGEGSVDQAIIKRSFKLYDKQRALETVLKMHGLLKDTVKHEGGIAVSQGVAVAMKKLMGDSDAFDAAIQLADRLKAVDDPDSEPNRN